MARRPIRPPLPVASSIVTDVPTPGGPSNGAAAPAADLFRLLADNVADYALYVIDADRRVRTWNPAAERLLGYAEAEVLGERADVFFTPEDRDAGRPEQEVREALATGRGANDRWHVRKDGTRFWSAGVLTPLRDADGRLHGFCKIMRDQTALKRADEARREAEERLRRSEERFRGLMDQAPFSVQIFSADGRTVRVNRAWEELRGAPARAADGYNVLEDRRLEAAGALPSLRKAFAGEPAFLPEIEYDPTENVPGESRHAEAKRRVAAVAYPIKDAGGAVREVVLVYEDVTARRRAEEELRRQRKLLGAIAENADSALVTVDGGGRLTFVNPAFTRITGYSAVEVIGRGVHETIHCKYPDGRPFPAAECPLDEAVRTGCGPMLRRKDVFVRKDGGLFPVVVSIAPIEEGGEVVGCVGEFRDVTAEMASEEALVRNEQVSRFLADAGVALAELSGLDETLRRVAGLAVPRFADWCAIDLYEGGGFRRAAAVHSDPAKVELGREFHRRFPPDPAGTSGLWKILRTGEPDFVPEITDAMLDAVGDAGGRGLLKELGLRSYVGVPLKVRDEVFGVVTFVSAESGRRFDERDLALALDLARRAAVAIENVRLYEDLRDADRRKNEFLAMLGHELRNPLAPIRSGLDLLKMSGAEPEVVDLMGGQVEHLVRLVDDLLDVSRILRGRVELKRMPTDLGEVVRRAVETARPMFEAQGQEFSVRLPSGAVRLEADAVRLTQVLANLLNNASKYTEPGGRVSLVAERDGREVVIRVADTGVGIDPDLLPHVFELFTQSTRSIDRSQGGLGLGLTIVRSLVEMHGGSVSVRSDGEGRGSEFVVRLPIAGTAVPESPVPVAAGAAGPGRRVLVVDDNVPAAKLLVRLLGKLGGHEVVTAHDGEGAVAAAEAYRPDLILLDIGLPKLDGYEVCRRLRARPEFAGTLLVALTGYGTEEDRRRSTEAGFDEHVTKPPSVEALRAVLAHPKLDRDLPAEGPADSGPGP